MLVKRSLGSSANEHIGAVLGFDNVLCRCLLHVVQTKDEDFEVYAFLPANRSLESITGFGKGGVYSNAASYLPRYLRERYGSAEDAVFLFDDVMANPSDAYLNEEESTLLTIESEVYHRCASGISEKSLEKLVWACGVSWHFVCAVIKNEAGKLDADMSESSFCTNIKGNLLEIIVGAFDGEGYIHIQVGKGGEKGEGPFF